MSWNSKRPLTLAHVILTKTLGVRSANDIRDRITKRMDLWERGIHAGLVGDAEVEGSAREGRSASGGEEEVKSIARSYYDMVLSGKLRQAVRWATIRKGGGCLLSDDQCTKTRRPVAEVLREKHPDTRTPLWKTPRAQYSRSMRRFRKRHPSISRRMT